LTGDEGDEADFVTMIIRQHPALLNDEPKSLDVKPSEVEGIKPALRT